MLLQRWLLVPLLLLLATAAPASGGSTSILTGAGPVPVVGSNQVVFTGRDDTLIQLARANGLGFATLAAANPGLDPWLPGAGRPLLLPYATILPDLPRPGITVNLAELRLYLFRPEEDRMRVSVYPIGIGDEGWETPEGEFAVRCKIERPAWTPPAAIRREHPELPPWVPPGPDNPLGGYWLGFSDTGHGIHGTNQPYGVGRRVSHGCLRLYPEDIRDLYDRVTVGTPVRIIYRPIKVGMRDGVLLVEAHRDYLRQVANPLSEVWQQSQRIGWQGKIDWKAVERVLAEARGIPLPISDRREAALRGAGES